MMSKTRFHDYLSMLLVTGSVIQAVAYDVKAINWKLWKGTSSKIKKQTDYFEAVRQISDSLSDEEKKILHSVLRQVSQDSSLRFPLFINGRPGSGKSTILQYIFAQYIKNI